MKLLLLILVILQAQLFLQSATVNALSCIRTSVAQRFESADIVFFGYTTSAEQEESPYFYTQMYVLESYTDNIEERTTIDVRRWVMSKGITSSEERNYVYIFADYLDDIVTTAECGGVLSADTEELNIYGYENDEYFGANTEVQDELRELGRQRKIINATSELHKQVGEYENRIQSAEDSASQSSRLAIISISLFAAYGLFNLLRTPRNRNKR